MQPMQVLFEAGRDVFVEALLAYPHVWYSRSAQTDAQPAPTAENISLTSRTYLQVKSCTNSCAIYTNAPVNSCFCDSSRI
jgi:hypothetical protein